MADTHQGGHDAAHSPEAAKQKEAREKREAAVKEILQNVRDAGEVVRDSVKILTDPKDQEYFKWIAKSVLDAHHRADKKTGQITVESFDDDSGKTISQQEGIPVDDLLVALDKLKKIAENDKKQDVADKIQKHIDVINKNSKSYTEIHKQGHEHWRTRLEAFYISKDFRQSDKTKDGYMDDDYKTAMTAMKNRRELVLPAEVDTDTTAPDAAKVDAKDTLPPAAETKKAPEAKETKRAPEIIPPADMHDIPPPNLGIAIDISEIVKRLARSQAEEKLHDYLRGERQKSQAEEKKGFFGRMLGKVADLGARIVVRMGEKKYQEKFYQECLREIQTNKNLMAEIEASIGTSKVKSLNTTAETKHYKILDTIINQYTQELVNAEEKGEIIRNDKVNQALGILFYDYAIGDIPDRRAFDNRLNADGVIDEIKGSKKVGVGEGLLFAHNFFEMAQKYKGYIENKIKELEKTHGPQNREVIRDHMKGILSLDIQLGLKQRDVRDTKPEGTLNWFDRLIDKAANTRFLGGALVNPATLGAGVGILTALGMRMGAGAGTRAGLHAAGGILRDLTPAIAGGLLGGVFGAMRKGWEEKRDRGTANREKALGKDAGGAHAAEMYKHTDMVRAEEVIAKLQGIDRLTGDNTKYVAEILARLGLEQKINVDFISAEVSEGKELGVKIESIGKIRLALNEIARKNGMKNWQELVAAPQLEKDIKSAEQALTESMAQKDRNFNSFRRKEMVKAGLFGAGVGIVGGVIGQAAVMGIKEWWEGTGFGSGLSHSVLGRATHGLANFMSGGELSRSALGPEAAIMGSGMALGHNGMFNLPKGFNFVPDGSGFAKIVDSSGAVLENHLPVVHTPEGVSLDKNALELLRHHGWQIDAKNIVTTLPRLEAVKEFDLPQGGKLKLPAGFSIDRASDGSVRLLAPTAGGAPKEILNNLHFLPDGQPTPDTVAALKQTGLDIGLAGTHTTELKDPRAIYDYIHKQYYNPADDSFKRVWHQNVDTRFPGGPQATTMDNIHNLEKTVPGFKMVDKYNYTFHTKGGMELHGSIEKVVKDLQNKDLYRALQNFYTHRTELAEVMKNINEADIRPETKELIKNLLEHPRQTSWMDKYDVAKALVDKRNLFWQAYNAQLNLENTPVTGHGRIHEWKELMEYAKFDKKTNTGEISMLKAIKELMAGDTNSSGIMDDKRFHLLSYLKAANGDVSKILENCSVRVYLNDADFAAGRGISVPVDVATGAAKFSRDELLGQLLFDNKGNLQLTTEINFYDKATGAHHVIATSPRAGGLNSLILKENVSAISSPGRETTAVDMLATPPDTIPVIPIPFVPRKPLEKGVWPETATPVPVIPPVPPVPFFTSSSEEQYISGGVSGSEDGGGSPDRSGYQHGREKAPRIEQIVDDFCPPETPADKIAEKKTLLLLMYQDVNLSPADKKELSKSLADYSKWLKDNQFDKKIDKVDTAPWQKDLDKIFAKYGNKIKPDEKEKRSKLISAYLNENPLPLAADKNKELKRLMSFTIALLS